MSQLYALHTLKCLRGSLFASTVFQFLVFIIDGVLFQISGLILGKLSGPISGPISGLISGQILDQISGP